MDWKVREIILWCLSMRITLSAVHISGQDNVEADRLSRFRIKNPRRLERSTKWSLDRRVTNLLVAIWGLPTVDFFATQAKQQGRGILFTPPRPSGGGLVQGSTVHVSPIAPPVSCSSQGDQGGGPAHSHSTMVAAKRVVSPSPAAPIGPASDVARARRSSTRPRRDRGTPASRLETLGRSLRSRGVSTEAAATISAAYRPSTRALYHAKWLSFCHWCSRWEKDPLHPSIRTVLRYLQHLRHRNLNHSTILSHISTLSSCTNKVDGVLVGGHPLVARWVLGDRAQNPPRRSLVPRWNLSVVLAALIENHLSLCIRPSPGI